MIDTSDPTLAGRYLANQLSEQERGEYETLVVSDAEVVAELEATARLKVGLERLRETGELQRLLQRRSRPGLSFMLAAAAVIVAVAIGLGTWLPRRLPGVPVVVESATSLRNASGVGIRVGSTVAVFHKRAGAADGVIGEGAAGTGIAIRVLPSVTSPSGRYHIWLSRVRTGEPQESVAELEATAEADGFVSVYADASRLTPGRYRLTLVGPEKPAEPDVFTIDVSDAKHQ
jgi:hypothetical protein